LVREIFPATFSSGEGSDLAGVVEEVGAGVHGVSVGGEVIGYSDNRASHAEYVLVEAANLTAKPAEVPWEVAGALFVAGVTGVATVRAVAPTAGEAVVIAGAGGGVGVFAVQLAVRTGARTIALATERHHAWLRERGAVPVAHGDGVRKRITAAAEETTVAAFIDLVGGGGERGDPGRAGRGDRSGRPRGSDPAHVPAGRRSSGVHRARGRSHRRKDRPHSLTGRASGLRPKARRKGYGSLDPLGDPGGVSVEIEPDVAVLVVDPREPLVDNLDDRDVAVGR
jgi:hypothetical protein